MLDLSLYFPFPPKFLSFTDLLIFGEFFKNKKSAIFAPKSRFFIKNVVFQFSRRHYKKQPTFVDSIVLRGKFPTFWYKNHPSKSHFKELRAISSLRNGKKIILFRKEPPSNSFNIGPGKKSREAKDAELNFSLAKSKRI